MTHMKKILHSATIACLVVFTMAAAEESAKKQPQPAPAETIQENPATFNLEFRGGTLGDFLKALEGASGEKPNVFITAEAEGLAIPKMDLRNVTTRAVMESLAYFMMEEYSRPLQKVGAGWVVRGRPERRKAQAFFVGDLLDKFKMQDVTTAIESTWRFSSKTVAPELKYHEDTHLLIVFAEPAQLEAVFNVLVELREGLGLKKSPPAAKR
jgi:hypothetical protein